MENLAEKIENIDYLKPNNMQKVERCEQLTLFD